MENHHGQRQQVQASRAAFYYAFSRTKSELVSSLIRTHQGEIYLQFSYLMSPAHAMVRGVLFPSQFYAYHIGADC